MAFAWAKNLNADNFSSDSMGCSNLEPVGTDTIWFAHENVTSLGAADSTMRIYARKYTISSGALSSSVDVSGADGSSKGWCNPSIAAISASNLVCGYSRGKYSGYWSGFEIKESADTGATWGSTYSGGGSFNAHSFRGLFKDNVTGTIYAITQAAPTSGGTVTVHKRTGVGTWTTTTAFSGGSASNYFNLVSIPQQNVIVSNGTMCIVGSRASGSSIQNRVSALYSTNLTAWTETAIASYSIDLRRIPLLVRGGDNKLRLLHTNGPSFNQGGPPVIAESSDYGLTWLVNATPDAFSTEDDYGAQVVFPPSDEDVVSLAIDGRDRQFMIVPDDASTRLHTFRAWKTGGTSWRLMESTYITNAGITYDPRNLSPQPLSSCIVGVDVFRVVAVWNDTPNFWSELWLLKNAGAGKRAGGAAGGGGTPKSFTEA